MSDIIKRIIGKVLLFGILLFGIMQNNEMALNFIKFIVIMACFVAPLCLCLPQVEKEKAKKRLAFDANTNIIIALAFSLSLASGGMIGYAIFYMLGSLVAYSAIYSEKETE